MRIWGICTGGKKRPGKVHCPETKRGYSKFSAAPQALNRLLGEETEINSSRGQTTAAEAAAAQCSRRARRGSAPDSPHARQGPDRPGTFPSPCRRRPRPQKARPRPPALARSLHCTVSCTVVELSCDPDWACTTTV